MSVPRCFCPQGSFSRIPGSRGLVGGLLPTSWHKPYYRKYSLPCTPRYCRQLQILAALLSFYPLAFFLYCLASAEIWGKRYGSSIISAVWVYRLGYPPGVKLEKAQRISPLAFDYIWFWYICYSTKLSRWKRNF